MLYVVFIIGGFGGVGFYMVKWLFFYESFLFINLLSWIGC